MSAQLLRAYDDLGAKVELCTVGESGQSFLFDVQ